MNKKTAESHSAVFDISPHTSAYYIKKKKEEMTWDSSINSARDKKRRITVCTLKSAKREAWSKTRKKSSLRWEKCSLKLQTTTDCGRINENREHKKTC
jgi:hypothetical protein